MRMYFMIVITMMAVGLHAADNAPKTPEASADNMGRQDAGIGDLPSDLQAKVSRFTKGVRRLSSGFTIETVPVSLANAQYVTVARGESQKATPAWSFSVSKEVIVYLLVQDRGKVTLTGWEKTSMKVEWTTGTAKFTDSIYVRSFPAGTVAIPGHDGRTGGTYGIPNACVVIVK